MPPFLSPWQQCSGEEKSEKDRGDEDETHCYSFDAGLGCRTIVLYRCASSTEMDLISS